MFVSHVKDMDGLANIADMDPDDRTKQFIDAGMPELGKKAASARQAAARAERAEEYALALGDNTSLWAERFPTQKNHTDNTDLSTPPEALATIIKALEHEVFDKIKLWSNAEATETLIIGVLNLEGSKQYFLLGQWGDHATTPEELRSRKVLDDVKKRLAQFRRTYWPVIASTGVAVMLLVGVGILHQVWLAILLPVAAVLYAVALVTLPAKMRKRKVRSAVVLVVAVISFMTSLISVVHGVEHYMTTPRTERALVCTVNGRDVRLSNGTIVSIQGGTYNGVKLDGQAAAKQINPEDTYIFTLHGHINYYATGAEKVTSTRSNIC
ncbi:MAG: hypothetical protein ACQR33_00485 [Candidatus Saccharibacteria bacterium]